ncbi:hypothetical protein DS691_20985 [Salmonella enterica subsp. enterica serovar Bareilly]|uniref:Uncharacterized protein n=1 Tax=Enterobacter phage KKP_3711 TaxID=3109398 RepID=A0AAX4Q468_9CAUD|nr:hypothetical protein [Salmonella enterica]EBX7861906.1 hypothetical protein [Salmonella enterica subsp. enterica serovar Bareilly]
MENTNIDQSPAEIVNELKTAMNNMYITGRRDAFLSLLRAVESAVEGQRENAAQDENYVPVIPAEQLVDFLQIRINEEEASMGQTDNIQINLKD